MWMQKLGCQRPQLLASQKTSRFLAEACKLVHPTVMAMSVGGMLVQNILSYNDPSGLHFRRIQCVFASKLVSLCAELREDGSLRKTLRKTSPSQPSSRLLALNSTWNLCRMAASVLETLQLVKKNLGTS